MTIKREDLPPTDGEWNNAWVRCFYSYVDEHLHNSLGPAVIYDDGTKHWWVDGKKHRLDGPAIECADGYKEWWVNDVSVFRQNFPSTVIRFLLGVDKETARIIEQEMKL